MMSAGNALARARPYRDNQATSGARVKIASDTRQDCSHRQRASSLSSRKLDELATDVDDAAMVVEELQAEPDVDASEKLRELKKTLEDASDAVDELYDEGDE